MNATTSPSTRSQTSAPGSGAAWLKIRAVTSMERRTRQSEADQRVMAIKGHAQHAAATAGARLGADFNLLRPQHSASTGPFPTSPARRIPKAQCTRPSSAMPSANTASPINPCQSRADRGAVQNLRRAQLRQHPILQHTNHPAHRERLRLVMRHQNRGGPRGFERAATASRVSARNPASSAENGSSSSTSCGFGASARANAHAAARRRRVPAARDRHSRRQIHHLQQFRHTMPRPPLRPLQPKRDVIGDREMRKQRALLRHIPDLPRLGRREFPIPREQRALQPDLTAIRPLKPSDQPQQRGLAAAGRAQDRHQAAGLHNKTHITQHPAPPKDFARCEISSRAITPPRAQKYWPRQSAAPAARRPAWTSPPTPPHRVPPPRTPGSRYPPRSVSPASESR